MAMDRDGYLHNLLKKNQIFSPLTFMATLIDMVMPPMSLHRCKGCFTLLQQHSSLGVDAFSQCCKG